MLSECESTHPLNPQTQPVSGANLCQDLFQRYHPERTLAERSVDGPEICATPLKQGGLRLNLRVDLRSIMPSNQHEILGIVFHTLRNRHSGLVIGCAGECCVAITRVAAAPYRSQAGSSGVVLADCSASSRVSLHFSPHIRLLAAAVVGPVSLHCDEPCTKEDLVLAVCCFLTGAGGGSEGG